MNWKIGALILLGIVVLAGGAYFLLKPSPSSTGQALRITVPPFVDTAMTTVGQSKGIFAKHDVQVTFVDTAWENQYDLITGGAVDIAMSTLDEFISKDKNLRIAGQQVLYFLPAWQFKGLGFYSAGGIRPLSEFQTAGVSSVDAKKEFLKQLTNKKIVFPEGSVFEEAFRSFVISAGMSINDFKVINASLDSSLNSLSDSAVGVVAVGSQQRPEVEKRGYKEAIAPEDLGLDILTGFIVRKSVYEERPQDVLNFACAWYETAKVATSDRSSAYSITNDYLTSKGSNPLTQDEYLKLIAYNVLPVSPTEGQSLFFSNTGKAYWMNVWTRTIESLTKSGKGDQLPPDDSGFIADEVNTALLRDCTQ